MKKYIFLLLFARIRKILSRVILTIFQGSLMPTIDMVLRSLANEYGWTATLRQCQSQLLNGKFCKTWDALQEPIQVVREAERKHPQQPCSNGTARLNEEIQTLVNRYGIEAVLREFKNLLIERAHTLKTELTEWLYATSCLDMAIKKLSRVNFDLGK